MGNSAFGFGFSSNVAQDEEGYIVLSDYSGTRRIGVTIEKYKELQEIADESVQKVETYYNRLVQLGDIIPKKSNEELMSDLIGIVKNLSERVDALSTQKNAGINDVQLHAISENASRAEQSTPTEGAGSPGLCSAVQSKQVRREPGSSKTPV